VTNRPVPPVARRGRPRDGRIDREITAAALDLLGEVGFEGFSVEEVTARAGVAKTTVYRRFPTRNDLIVAALERLNDDLEMPSADLSTRDRLVAAMSSVRERKSGQSARDRLLHIVSTQSADPELQLLVRRRVIEPRRAGLRRILETGVARNELRADLDVDSAMALLVGAMFYLGAADRIGGDITVTVEDAVDWALRGLASRTDG
jgi:AcrR family transcriptional regulator